MQPVVETCITQHTLWQALTGQTPPLALPALPIIHAALDSRDITPGDLFIAYVGENTDGHRYIRSAVERGARAVIAEPHGKGEAEAAGALLIDCTQGAGYYAQLPAAFAADRALVYLVDSTLAAFQKVGAFQRLHRCTPDLVVVGITGSVGKTSTKELCAAVLRQRYRTLHSRGNLNGG
ncbi:MAG TPA: Mur ligase domain-containing protein, partial [Caldilineaceae bacterium]|nr:Mur ligase domain-containing protein [Caldilineaceae bacterium]